MSLNLLWQWGHWTRPSSIFSVKEGSVERAVLFAAPPPRALAIA
jgi:hypothetical protein